MSRPRLDARHHLAARHSLFPLGGPLGGPRLLAAVIVDRTSLVAINVLINQWNNRFYNALQDRNWDAFVSELLYLLHARRRLHRAGGLSALSEPVAADPLAALDDRRYLDHWLDGANHYRMQLLATRPTTRTSASPRTSSMFIERALTIGIGLLSAIVTLGSFVVILWGLSAAAPLHAVRRRVIDPGLLVWAALIYAIVGTAAHASGSAGR